MVVHCGHAHPQMSLIDNHPHLHSKLFLIDASLLGLDVYFHQFRFGFLTSWFGSLPFWWCLISWFSGLVLRFWFITLVLVLTFWLAFWFLVQLCLSETFCIPADLALSFSTLLCVTQWNTVPESYFTVSAGCLSVRAWSPVSPQYADALQLKKRGLTARMPACQWGWMRSWVCHLVRVKENLILLMLSIFCVMNIGNHLFINMFFYRVIMLKKIKTKFEKCPVVDWHAIHGIPLTFPCASWERLQAVCDPDPGLFISPIEVCLVNDKILIDNSIFLIK